MLPVTKQIVSCHVPNCPVNLDCWSWTSLPTTFSSSSSTCFWSTLSQEDITKPFFSLWIDDQKRELVVPRLWRKLLHTVLCLITGPVWLLGTFAQTLLLSTGFLLKFCLDGYHQGPYDLAEWHLDILSRNTPPFVFSISDPPKNARSLLTPVSDPAFQALSHGCLSFALHGSFLNHFLIGQNSSTANQNLRNKWLLELP